MKKVIPTLFTLSVILLTLSSLHADEKSKTLLNTLATQMQGYSSYEMKFLVSSSLGLPESSGKAVVSGDRYYMSLDSTEVFFNGQATYTFNHRYKTVLIETPAAGDHGFLSNPARFFHLYDSDFTHTYKGQMAWRGTTVDVVELVLKGSSDQVKILLRLTPSSGKIAGLTYLFDNYSAEIVIQKMTPNLAVSNATFTFDRNKHPDVEVIDFR